MKPYKVLNKPNNYWANFIQEGNYIYRFDTRIYLNPVSNIENDHKCIGAIVGKNPGSAKSKSLNSGLKPINLDHDSLLPNVLSIVLKAYKEVSKKPLNNEYIQVLNLFYLCNPDLKKAINEHKDNNLNLFCPTEKLTFPWVWYVWGDFNKELNIFKERFDKINSKNHFYYYNKLSKVISKIPKDNSFARHTQGLKHNFIYPYLATIIK